jgi:hypothetical protein
MAEKATSNQIYQHPLDIFEWSVREIKFEFDTQKQVILIGNALMVSKLVLALAHKINFDKRLFYVEGLDNGLTPCGYPGMSDQGIKLWTKYKKLNGVVSDVDVSDRYLKYEDSLLVNHIFFKGLM